jgi:hypothetical protein
MFEFLKKGPPATPAYEVATALWIHGVSDDPMMRGLAAAASEENSLSEAIVLDEAVYFMSFATDLTIHRVFKSDASVEHALREEFLDHVRGYARYQQCTPCPVGDWLADSNIWEIRSPGRDTGNPVQHLSDRFDLYAATMRRPSERGRSLRPLQYARRGLHADRDRVFHQVFDKHPRLSASHSHQAVKRVLQTKNASELLFVGYPALPDNQDNSGANCCPCVALKISRQT